MGYDWSVALTQGYNELKAFTEHFTVLAQTHPALSPPLASALVQLAALPADSEEMHFDALTMGQQHMFFKSKLYMQCMAQKVDARVLRVRNLHTEANHVRLHTVVELLKHELTDEQKTHLEFGRTMLSSLLDSEKISFLLEAGIIHAIPCPTPL